MEVSTADRQATSDSRQAIEAIDPPGFPDRVIKVKWLDPGYSQILEKDYTQATLGMFPVQEFTTLISETLQQFIDGDLGIKLGELFRGEIQAPVVTNEGGGIDAEAVEDFLSDNMQIVQAFIKLVQKVPELQLEIMCLSLGIPRLERAWAKERMQEPPHRGGFTVPEGFDILIWFIRQNAELVRETVLGKAQDLVAEFQLHVLHSEDHEMYEGKARKKVPLESSSVSTETASTAEAETPTPQPSSPGGTPSSTSSPDIPVSV